jgi:transcriptional regulator with PAS, ATPase and Fis domain
MKQDRLEEIFEHQGFGIAWFSSDLSLVRCSPIFKIFSRSTSVEPQTKIGNVIPEAIGLEEVLKNLLTGKEKYFSLENVNRKWHMGQILFFDLYFYAFDDRKVPLICLVKEVTVEGRQEQQIKQQKYEIRLLEDLLYSRRRILSESIIGDSEPIRKIRDMIDKVSRKRAKAVLLLGETGTGKNLAARMIHRSLEDSDVPFVEVNSAAIPETQLESELFGYEKGAFAGATDSRKGLIEDADGGILFLDEIGELSKNIQAKLISFLDSGKYRRLGSHKKSEVNVRLIAASNRNLQELVKEGQFREDLYLRLNVLTMTLPPLRELGNDILKIALHFVDVYNTELKKNISGFTEAAEKALHSHPWPGNVRELANYIERSMIFIDKERIDTADLSLPSSPEEDETSN